MRSADPAALAGFIQGWLRDHGLSQLALAQRAGIPHSTISVLFSRHIVPRPPTLRRLAEAMGVPVGQLLVLAGHLSQSEYEEPIGKAELARLYDVGDLTEDEWGQVLDFARYVRGKRRKGR